MRVHGPAAVPFHEKPCAEAQLRAAVAAAKTKLMIFMATRQVQVIKNAKVWEKYTIFSEIWFVLA